MNCSRLYIILTLLALLLAGQGAWAQTGSDMPASITYHDNGDNTGYYEIGSPQALYDLQVYVKGGTYSDNSTNKTFHPCNNLKFRQTADIDMKDINGFTGIGEGEMGYPFQGHYNGQDHVVRNLTINNGNDSYRGLFGHLVQGVVEHVIVDSAAITGSINIGGIAGFVNSSNIQNCFVLNTEITANPVYGSPYSGAIVGNCIHLSGCIYYNSSVHNAKTKETSTTNIGNGAKADDDNCRRVQKITLSTGVSVTGTGIVNYNSNAYCPPSTIVTLNCTVPDGYSFTGYSVKDANNDDVSVSESAGVYTFTMPDGDVTVSATLSMNWTELQDALNNSSTDADNPTVITLDKDIVASSTDSYLNIPAGHHVIIDLNGHKIDRALTEPDNNGCVIKVNGVNATLVIQDNSVNHDGTITGGYYNSGLAGGIDVYKGTLTLESGSISGNKCNFIGGGGICLRGGKFYMTGGSITGNVANTSKNSEAECGGAIFFYSDGEIHISGGSITGNYCHTPAKGCAGIGGYPSTTTHTEKTYLNGTYTLSGNYEGTYNDVNGVWTNTIASDYLHGKYDYIYLEGAITPSAATAVKLHPNWANRPRLTSGWNTYMGTAGADGYFSLLANSESSGKIIGPKDGNLYLGTPEAVYWHADDDHDGSSDKNAYIITTTQGLDLLAKQVNGTDGYTANEFKNTYFKLGADIAYNPNALTVDLDDDGTPDSNYMPIGRQTTQKDYSFRGTFDGQGHTVSGIRACHYDGGYVALFGENNGTVTGVVLSDCYFGGRWNVGGIVGYNRGTISDCRVESSVSIRGLTSADLASSLGGITGYNSGGTIAGCLSAAAVNPDKVSARVVGGIAGVNYFIIQDCLYVGTTVNATGEQIGAICGSNSGSGFYGIIANTYYIAAPNLPGQKTDNGYDLQRGDALFGRGYEVTLNEGAAFFDNARTYTVSGLAAYAEPDKEEGGQTYAQFGYALQYTPTSGGEPVIYSCIQQTIRLKAGLTRTGYEFGGYSVAASNAEQVDVNHNTGEDGNYYYFTMPSNADVTVTAIWTTDAKTLTGVSAEGIVGYWATWFGHARFVLPEGAAAYTMDSEHKLYRLGDDGRTIPAGVAVVIISDKETIALTPDTSTGTTTVTDHAPGGNILRGSNSATTVSGTPYALGVVNGVLGFYEYTGGPVPAHKAYYVQ